MRRKLVVIGIGIVAVGLASALPANAGTEIVRDYGGGPVNNYSPPPPPPVYYAPPPVVIYPTYAFFGPRFSVVAVHRFHGHRVLVRPHHRFR